MCIAMPAWMVRSSSRAFSASVFSGTGFAAPLLRRKTRPTRRVVFSRPGLGNTLVVSVANEDGALTAGVLVCASIIATAASLLVDAVCAVAEPRFRSF